MFNYPLHSLLQLRVLQIARPNSTSGTTLIWDNLSKLKLGNLCDETISRNTLMESFTEYHMSLFPLMITLRNVVFPAGGEWMREDEGLYGSTQRILHESINDIRVYYITSKAYSLSQETPSGYC